MPIRGSPNGARHPRPQAGRDRPEWVVAINRNAWSQSIGIAGRNHPVRAATSRGPHGPAKCYMNMRPLYQPQKPSPDQMIAVGTLIAEYPRTDPSGPNSGTRLPPRVIVGKPHRRPRMKDAGFWE